MINISSEYKQAFEAIQNKKDVFITGKGGTGKSTFLRLLKQKLDKRHINYVVLAPTGIAANNVNGETIHSFFKFGVGEVKPVYINKKKELFKHLELIIIDEVSMLRADLLDNINESLKINKCGKKDFGGVQMIFIGDLFQLPPVVINEERELFSTIYRTPYFLSANVLQDHKLKLINFTKIYRQNDDRFISILNEIRNGNISDESLKILNKQVKTKIINDDILITTTNKIVNMYNNAKLNLLETKQYTFDIDYTGNGQTQSKNCLVENQLNLKVGARVMLLINDIRNRWINGSLGVVNEINKNMILVTLDDTNTTVSIERYTWEIKEYIWNEEEEKIDVNVIGSFTQYPLKLAYASTIHKVQGKTFSKMNLDLGYGTFAPGQLYVALSRCRSLDGITLVRPIKKQDVKTDKMVIFLYNNIYGNFEVE